LYGRYFTHRVYVCFCKTHDMSDLTRRTRRHCGTLVAMNVFNKCLTCHCAFNQYQYQHLIGFMLNWNMGFSIFICLPNEYEFKLLNEKTLRCALLE